MADELISRQAALEAFEWADADVCEADEYGSDWGFGRKNIKDVLSKLPAIDPASLRPKGEWITISYWKKRRGHHVQYVVKKCSHCNFRVKARWKNNFCPNCGADMRGDNNEA